MQNDEAECCPKFNPEGLNEKAVIWDEKPFVRSKVKCFFRMPRDFGKVVVANMESLKAAGAKNTQNMMLSDCKSMWSMDLYTAVDKEVAGAENVKLSGTFITKVFEGPFKNSGKWANEMAAYVASKNKNIKRMLFWYTTCPKCAKKYGKNYVVLFAEIEKKVKLVEAPAEKKESSESASDSK